ncbi:MAG: hypothetical protein ACHQIO_17145 [Nevskiales bacterium]
MVMFMRRSFESERAAGKIDLSARSSGHRSVMRIAPAVALRILRDGHAAYVAINFDRTGAQQSDESAG